MHAAEPSGDDRRIVAAQAGDTGAGGNAGPLLIAPRIPAAPRSRPSKGRVRARIQNRDELVVPYALRKCSRMWKKVALAVLLLTLGAGLGCWLRGEIAVDTCLDMGGQWLKLGYCNGATKYSLE